MRTALRAGAGADPGGLAPFGVYIAEDFYMSQALHNAGKVCVVSSLGAVQRSAPRNVAHTYGQSTTWYTLTTS